MKNSEEILEKSKAATAKLIPLKSEERYNKEYKVFNECRQHEVNISHKASYELSSVKILPYRKNVFYCRVHPTVKPNITGQYEIEFYLRTRFSVNSTPLHLAKIVIFLLSARSQYFF